MRVPDGPSHIESPVYKVVEDVGLQQAHRHEPAPQPEHPLHLTQHLVHPLPHLHRVLRHQGVHRPFVQHHAVALILAQLQTILN